MPFGEGSQIGHRYRLVSQVGRGGMGKVWLAHDDLLHREIAVKEVLFPPGLSESERGVLYERTLREARHAARLSHHGIVTVHDVVEEDGRPWIVMEYVRARSLQQVIDEDGRMPPALVADIGVQVLDALRSAHAAGVLHRDVKPANILLDVQDAGAPRAVITDFGIARAEGDSTLTQTGLVLGSPAYIAPERAMGENATAASDIWALGATLYAAVEGKAPHDRPEAMAALNAVLTQEAPPPEHAGPLATLLLSMLVKDPAQRVTSGQVADDLALIARGAATGRAPQTSDATRNDVDDRTMLDPVRVPADHEKTFVSHGSAGTEAPPPMTVHERFGPGPTGGPPGTEAYEPAPRRSKMVVPAVLFVLVLVAAAAAYLVYRAGHSAGTGATTSPSPSAPPSRSVSPSASQAPSSSPRRSVGPEGSSLAVPAGWTRQRLSGASVRWTQRSTGAQIQVDTIPWGVADPVEHWRKFEGEVLAKGTLPGYQRIRLGDEYADRGWQVADLEYSWHTSSYGTMRAFDRGFTANGHQYAVFVAAPSAKWSRYSGLVSSLFGSFQPAP